MRIDHTLCAPLLSVVRVDCNGHHIAIGDTCRLCDVKIEEMLLQNDRVPDPLCSLTAGWEHDFGRKWDRDNLRTRLRVLFSVLGFIGDDFMISTNHNGKTEIGQVSSSEMMFVYRPAP